jgi:hypothetical protein
MLFLLQQALKKKNEVSVCLDTLLYTTTHPDLPSPHPAPVWSTSVLDTLHRRL